MTSPSTTEEGVGPAESVTARLDRVTDRLFDAMSEIQYLRVVVEGAVIGSRIIEQQFERADEGSILQWAHRQAKANREHAEEALAISRHDFPFEGAAQLALAIQPAATQSTGATS